MFDLPVIIIHIITSYRNVRRLFNALNHCHTVWQRCQLVAQLVCQRTYTKCVQTEVVLLCRVVRTVYNISEFVTPIIILNNQLTDQELRSKAGCDQMEGI